MKPPPFSYHDPANVADAVKLLSTLENAKLLAGGQSLMPMLNMRYVLPDHVIDEPELQQVALAGGLDQQLVVVPRVGRPVDPGDGAVEVLLPRREIHPRCLGHGGVEVRERRWAVGVERPEPLDEGREAGSLVHDGSPGFSGLIAVGQSGDRGGLS